MGQRLASGDECLSREQLEEEIQIGITFLVDFRPGLFSISFNMQVLTKSV